MAAATTSSPNTSPQRPNGLTVLKDRVRELRPLYLPPDPSSRTLYLPGIGWLVWDNEPGVGGWSRGRPRLSEEFEAFRGLFEALARRETGFDFDYARGLKRDLIAHLGAGEQRHGYHAITTCVWTPTTTRSTRA
jgi:hypothetical protein